MAGYQLTPVQLTELRRMLEAIPENTTQVGAYTAIYQELYSYLTQRDLLGRPSPISPAVDHNVWMWLWGAQQVNSASGAFAGLIRNYTIEQYKIRYGQQLSETELQKASNDLAREFIQEFTGVYSNGLFSAPRGSPDIELR